MQPLFDLKGGAEGGNDDDIARGEFIPGDQLRAIGVHDEFHAASQQVTVHFLVVDHLAQQEHAGVRILLQGTVTDLYGVFNPVAKAKVAGEVELNRPKIE